MRRDREKATRIKVPKDQKIVRCEIADDGKSLVYYTKPEEDNGQILSLTEYKLEQKFPIVDIEGISLEDEFLQIEPSYSNGRRIKENIIKAKKNNMKNFRISAIDPSYDKKENMIIFEPENKPAVGYSYFWWRLQARRFCYKKNSRLISPLEMDVALGFLIKNLYENEGYSKEEAWYAVCCNSKRLGHYYNAAKPKNHFEKTGKRKVCVFYDLANTSKIAYNPETGEFVEYGGAYTNCSKTYPLAYTEQFINIDKPRELSTGKIVIDI